MPVQDKDNHLYFNILQINVLEEDY